MYNDCPDFELFHVHPVVVVRLWYGFVAAQADVKHCGDLGVDVGTPLRVRGQGVGGCMSCC
jgi:hypothetical protein